MGRLIYSEDRDDVIRQQGVAQAMIAVVGLPVTLEEEIAAEHHRVRLRAGFTPEGTTGDTGEGGPEPY